MKLSCAKTLVGYASPDGRFTAEFEAGKGVWALDTHRQLYVQGDGTGASAPHHFRFKKDAEVALDRYLQRAQAAASACRHCGGEGYTRTEPGPCRVCKGKS